MRQISTRSLPYSRSCFVCGVENPYGLRMRFFSEKGIVRATFRLAEHHVGFRGVAHGGILATVLDEAMAWAGAVKMRRFGFCAEMNVRFLQVVHPGEELTVKAELVAGHKRLWDLSGEITDAGGAVYAKATAKFVPLSDDQLKNFMGDLCWDETTLKSEEVFNSPAEAGE